MHLFTPLKSLLPIKTSNTSTHSDEIMQEQVLGPINYSDGKCYIIDKENYEHFSKSSDKIIGRLSCEGEYYVINKDTYNTHLNDQQQSTSNSQFTQQQIFGPIKYQNKETYAISALAYSKKIHKSKFMGRIHIYDEYYAISEEEYREYLSKIDQKKKQQLQQFMQKLVRPIKHGNTECYGTSKENYEYILDITSAIRKIKLDVNDVYCIISKAQYDKYIQAQNDRIRPFLQKLVLEQKICQGKESYLINEENYKRFVEKIQNPQQKLREKELRREKYYEINLETFMQNKQNDQQVPEQQDELSFMQQQVIGQLYYLNKECYLIDKENYEYFFKLSKQQSEGQIKIKEEYSVIGKEIYDNLLKQITSRSLQLMQRQILGPVNCLNGKTYIIGEAYEKLLTDEPVIRKIKINKEYYIVDKEAYDKCCDRLRFQQFIQRLSAKQMTHDNTECFGIIKDGYKYYISEIIPNEHVTKNLITVKETYYVIRKDSFHSYFQHDQQIQKFMGRFVYDWDDYKGYYVIFKENYDCFFKNIIINKELEQTTFKEYYYGINKEAYDKYILQIDRQKDPTPEQQVQQVELIIQQNFTQHVLGQLNFLGKECYVLDRENYNHFLKQVQQKTPNQQEVINQNVRPISVNYYVIIKETYDFYLRPVEFNSRNNTKNKESEELFNELSSINQALREECDKLKAQNDKLKGDVTVYQTEAAKHQKEAAKYKSEAAEYQSEAIKYQSALGDATSFHLGSQDSNNSSQLSEDIRNLHDKLVKFCGVKRDHFTINYPEVNKLMEKYDCSTTNGVSKNLISGLLERVVIETILEKTEVYLNYEKIDDNKNNDGDSKEQQRDLTKNPNTTNGEKQHLGDATDTDKQLEDSETKKPDATDKDKQLKDLETKKSDVTDKQQDLGTQSPNIKDNENLESKILDNKKQRPDLEAKIFNTTEKLLEMTELFTRIRKGTDRVSDAVPRKLRQQVYAILGNRGFSKTSEDENNSIEHPFIVKLRDDIMDLMNRYRTFNNPKKLRDSEKAINDIIRDVINIFFFRLNVQVPIATWDWLPKDTEINELRMEASWDVNEIDSLHFDVCAFPLIGSNLSQTEEKVIFPAQVVMDTPD